MRGHDGSDHTTVRCRRTWETSWFHFRLLVLVSRLVSHWRDWLFCVLLASCLVLTPTNTLIRGMCLSKWDCKFYQMHGKGITAVYSPTDKQGLANHTQWSAMEPIGYTCNNLGHRSYIMRGNIQAYQQEWRQK